MIIDTINTKLLSISVMAHPSREKFFPELKEKLGDDVPFSIDENSEGVWLNARRAWSMYDPTALYHAVIQDDAVVCDDFHERASQTVMDAIRAVGSSDVAISFYFGHRGNLKHIAQEGLKRGYCTMNRTRWGVGICLPTRIIPQMLEECETYGMPQDDVRIGKFLIGKGIRVYYPLPSLVDHRTENNGNRSLVADHGGNRRAYKFIDS